MSKALAPKGNHSLIPGENVIQQMHPHWALLAKPLLNLIGLIGLVYLYFHFFHMWLPNHSPKIDLVFLTITGIALIPWVVAPYVKWATTMYLFTDQRIVTRTGLFRIEGETIPLNKINSISFSKSLLERLYGSGSLKIESAAEDEAIIKHVRGAENIQREIYELMSKFEEKE